jgi:hypothetical protein
MQGLAWVPRYTFKVLVHCQRQLSHAPLLLITFWDGINRHSITSPYHRKEDTELWQVLQKHDDEQTTKFRFIRLIAVLHDDVNSGMKQFRF